jgi:hypothetical protein
MLPVATEVYYYSIVVAEADVMYIRVNGAWSNMDEK